MKKTALFLCVMFALFGLAAACSTSDREAEDSKTSTEEVTISLLTDNTLEFVNVSKAVIHAFQLKYPHIEVEHEIRPPGAEGDDFVRTRLATGDMNDILFYNAGSLFRGLHPEEHFLDLSKEPFVDRISDAYKPAVSVKDKVYGVPAGSIMGGGWLYNKRVYADLGLQVPTTWAELMANNERIQAAGIVPVVGTYKDSWTTQMIVLADYYYVQAKNPEFAEKYTVNQAKFVTTPSALRSFEKLQELAERGFYNDDYAATTYAAGLRMLAEGHAAHYPMLTFAVPQLDKSHPTELDDIGFFAQPGDAAAQNGLTVWMPAGAYISNNSEHPREAKLFLEYLTSLEGISAWSSASKPTGPWAIKGAEIGDDISEVVKDMLPYFESNRTALALEFVSPIKGPTLPQFTTQVGMGMMSAKEAAAGYDRDIETQARQLELEGW